ACPRPRQSQGVGSTRAAMTAALSFESPVPCEDDRLRAAPDAELVEEIRDVVADGLLADREAPADVGVGETLRNQRQDLALSRRGLREGGILLGGTRGARSRLGRDAHEIEDDLLEARPRRLVLEKDVVARVELDELCSRNFRGRVAGLGDGTDLVVA